MLGPLLLGGRVHLDGVVAVVAEVDQGVGDEVHLVAVVARVVAGGRVRAAGEEEVGEAGRSGSRGTSSGRRPSGPRGRDRAGPGSPFAASAPVPKSKPVAQTTMSNSTGAVGGLDPVGGHAHDRRLAEVDQRDVGPVERLVVAGDEGRPLLARSDGPSGSACSAVSGSSTMPRIFSATNSHHSALAARSNSRSV